MQSEINTAVRPFFFSDDLLNLKNEIAFLSSEKRKLFILTDTNTHQQCYHILEGVLNNQEAVHVLIIKAGEEHKNIETAEKICFQLIEKEADRKSVLINLGGGMVTDMGGFVASIFKRGIDCIHVPTTLLAMTDAAIGGKTAINIGKYKNQVGSFREPKSVFNYLPFLNSLDKRQLRNGLAEMLKHGLIADREYFFDLMKCNEDFVTKNFIERSVAIKMTISDADPFETGARKLLNFGHTIGHAVESFFQHSSNPLLHGEAVAIGLLCESYISFKHCGLKQSELEEITQSVQKYFGHQQHHFSFSDILQFMKADKKNINGNISFTLLNRIGTGCFNQHVTDALIDESISWYLNK